MLTRNFFDSTGWVVGLLLAFIVVTVPADASALANLSIGSAHPAVLVNLTSDNNGLQGIDWHMHPCAFKLCFPGIAPQPFFVIASIMETRGAMTMETDQEQWNNGYEKYQYDQVVQFNGGKPIANYAVPVRP